jgi:histidyl-tRNA synthetase
LQGGRTSRSSTSCHPFSITCASLPRALRRGEEYLDDRGIVYEVRPRMVRGLDYYMRTTFEVVHGALGAQNSVLGGGRYDGLAESLGSKSAFAGHRILDRRRPPGDERGTGAGGRLSRSRSICSSPRWASRRCGHAAAGARFAARGCSVELGLEAKLKRSLELANKLGARFALIVGDNEMAAGQYTR